MLNETSDVKAFIVVSASLLVNFVLSEMGNCLTLAVDTSWLIKASCLTDVSWLIDKVEGVASALLAELLLLEAIAFADCSVAVKESPLLEAIGLAGIPIVEAESPLLEATEFADCSVVGVLFVTLVLVELSPCEVLVLCN